MIWPKRASRLYSEKYFFYLLSIIIPKYFLLHSLTLQKNLLSEITKLKLKPRKKLMDFLFQIKGGHF